MKDALRGCCQPTNSRNCSELKSASPTLLAIYPDPSRAPLCLPFSHGPLPIASEDATVCSGEILPFPAHFSGVLPLQGQHSASHCFEECLTNHLTQCDIHLGQGARGLGPEVFILLHQDTLSRTVRVGRGDPDWGPGSWPFC